MAAIYGQRAITGVGFYVPSLLAGQVYEFIPSDSMIEIGLTQSLALAFVVSIACDQDIVLQDVGESNVLTKTTAPIYPDDFNYNFACMGGSRLIISVRALLAGPNTLFYGVRINPV